jgi:hypothetical protein
VICKSVLHSQMLPKCCTYVVSYVRVLYSGEEDKQEMNQNSANSETQTQKEETFNDWNQNHNVLNEFSGHAYSTWSFFVLWSKAKSL